MRRALPANLPRLLSVGKVAEVFGRSTRWVRLRIMRGDLAAYKDKGGLMIAEASVKQYLERCRLVILRQAPPPPGEEPPATAVVPRDGEGTA